jgi:bacterioferritin B
VLISPELTKAINEQIGNEFGASLQYMSIAAHFSRLHLSLLSKLFFEQADEERQHALKFVRYVLDTKGDLRIPAIQAPVPVFASAEAAVQAALTWEQDVTRQITGLMDLAVKLNDYMAQSFLQWFIDEQLEEVVKMDRLLSVIRQSGEKNLLMVEAYLVHIEKAGWAPEPTRSTPSSPTCEAFRVHRDRPRGSEIDTALFPISCHSFSSVWTESVGYARARSRQPAVRTTPPLRMRCAPRVSARQRRPRE